MSLYISCLLLVYVTMDTTAGAACGAGDAHSSGAPDLTPFWVSVVFSWLCAFHSHLEMIFTNFVNMFNGFRFVVYDLIECR